jgi:hypothetical protein
MTTGKVPIAPRGFRQSFRFERKEAWREYLHAQGFDAVPMLHMLAPKRTSLA